MPIAHFLFRMTPIAKRPGLAEPAPAQLDLTGDLGNRGLDRVPGIIQDHHRALDDDGAGRFKGEGDWRCGGFFGHVGNIVDSGQGSGLAPGGPLTTDH